MRQPKKKQQQQQKKGTTYNEQPANYSEAETYVMLGPFQRWN